MTSPTLDLISSQLTAIERILAWLITPNTKEFRLGGYAGTGKTTVIKFLLDYLKNADNCPTVVCAFTGKAVHVLERKGVPAQTLHSLLYHAQFTDSGFKFTKRACLEGNPRLVIIDEASMLSKRLYEDLCSFKVKLLFVGDPGQLEPVGDNPDLMATCDYVLTTIHRQAEDSTIIRLANEIRHGKNFAPYFGKLLPDLHVQNKNLTSELLLAADQVICAKNKTRRHLNTSFRSYHNRTSASILPQDKLIILRNNMDQGLFNGMILFADKAEYRVTEGVEHWLVDAKDETGKEWHGLKVWNDPFTREIPSEQRVPKVEDVTVLIADYGYAITCHKAQGSEWDKVLVVDEGVPDKVWDMKRWRYTAITRAAKHLTYCI